MNPSKEDLEAMGRRYCRYKGIDPEQPLTHMDNMPAWMAAAMTITDMMLMNRAVKDHIDNLPTPEAPPDKPLVFNPN